MGCLLGQLRHDLLQIVNQLLGTLGRSRLADLYTRQIVIEHRGKAFRASDQLAWSRAGKSRDPGVVVPSAKRRHLVV